MKNLVIALIIVLSAQFSAKSNIINGYLRDVQLLELEIRKATTLLNKATRKKDSVHIAKDLRKLKKEYEKINIKFTETEELIRDIQIIDPQLYEKVSNLTNAEGTLTHVYVRYTNRTSGEIRYLFEGQFKAFGYTSVIQDKKNENVCTSYFGANTINVIVCKGSDEKFVLAHEFGHVLFIVPNLKEYILFSQDRNNSLDPVTHTGHNAYDPSNETVKSVEDSFSGKYKDYRAQEKNNNFGDTDMVSKKL
jgi:hypothetical protein